MTPDREVDIHPHGGKPAGQIVVVPEYRTYVSRSADRGKPEIALGPGETLRRIPLKAQRCHFMRI